MRNAVKHILVSDSSYNLNISESGYTELLFSEGVPSDININVSITDGCRVHLLEKYDAECRVVFRYNIGKNARLVHGRLAAAHNNLVYDIFQDSDSSYDMYSLYKSSVHDTVNVHLSGEDSVCNLKSVAFLHDDSSVIAKHSVIHEAKDCTSSQYFKTVLDDNTRCDFRGNIIVQRDASGTDGKQLCKTLMLSDDAKMNAVPKLEIMNDNVKCSHGNTIGSLDENAVFYLCSRGLSAYEAKKLLIDGFVREIIDDIPDAEWKEHFNV
ncbi:MAG: SufD family Fe-S cluster assembly protein [Alphaproteobacteria bacterium]|nr:SufD family Fe-S cluster assembly protein [Alphaproteobacteria bacterium]MCL2505406.1 SufD family Fe-S cluster assembly protein [Alphaproteobacteria bacterium]